MTKQEFIDGYYRRSTVDGSGGLIKTTDGIATADRLRMVALPCACDEPECDGWAMISNDPDLIRHHLYFYGPDDGRPEKPFD